MKSRVVVIWVVLLLFVLACTSMVGQAAKKPIVIRLGHIASVDHPTHLAALKFAELVEARTNGEVKVRVYPSSQLGDQRDMQEGLQIGTLEMAIIGTAEVGRFQPEYNIAALPYLFRNQAHVHAVMNGEVGRSMADKLLERTGIRVLDQHWDRAPRHLLTKRPVRTPDDLKGLKLRVPEQPVHIESWRAVGANPTGIPFSEVFTALQQGTIDGLENPVDFLYTGGYYEVAKYLTLTGHSLQVQAVEISDRFYQSLPAGTRKVIEDSVIEAGDYQNELIKAQESWFLEKMKEKGVEVITCDTELFAKKMTLDVLKKLAASWGGMELYERIQAVK